MVLKEMNLNSEKLFQYKGNGFSFIPRIYRMWVLFHSIDLTCGKCMLADV